MRKTTFAGTAAALLVLASVAAAETISVPKDHATIQAAVDAAEDGDTILIGKGTYAEGVVVDGLDNLTIQGKGKVIIRPPNAGTNALTVTNCNTIVVQGLRTTDGLNGFDFQGCNGVTLTKFRASGMARHGVFAAGSQNVDLSKGKIDRCDGDGVAYADETPGSPVTGGTITQVKVNRVGEDGVDILGSNVTVSKCNVSNCGDDGYESDQDGAGPVRFENCKSTRVDDEGFEIGCVDTTAVKCQAKRSRDNGFDIEKQADNATLEKCTAKKSAESGFEFEDRTGISATNCKSIGSQDHGFYFTGASNSSLTDCKATKSTNDGVFIDGGSLNITLTRCKASKSGDFDLDDEGTNTTITDSKFKKVDDNN